MQADPHLPGYIVTSTALESTQVRRGFSLEKPQANYNHKRERHSSTADESLKRLSDAENVQLTIHLCKNVSPRPGAQLWCSLLKS